MFLLDTNIIIAYFKGNHVVKPELRRVSSKALPFVTLNSFQGLALRDSEPSSE